MKFTDLDLPEELQRGIADCGFARLTPVQAQSLPITLQGRDLAVQAQTGSGKTAAFVVTIFDRLLREPRREPRAKGPCPRAIVLTPTRELTVQVSHDAAEIGRHLPFRTLAVYGGVDYQKQREDLAHGVDLLVGTPGRLIDYLKQRVYHLKDVEVAVIDEADRMFDMGFIADIRFLLKRMSRFDERQSMLYSATLSDRVMELSYEYMNVPELVEVSPEKVTADRVEQVLYHVSSREKFRLLLGLLRTEEWTKALVFVNTKRQAEILRERLDRNGYPTAVLSGDVDQVRRLKILRRFMAGELRILVATDVASRGLHIEGISHVVNYDLPQDEQDYVHRIGRTARAGASGKAVSLACENYVFGLEAIEQYIGQKIPVAWASEELLATKEVPRPRTPTPAADEAALENGATSPAPRPPRPRSSRRGPPPRRR
ncbi:MAG: DEAD/DEAH box helicase [Deltaproteobacteria bacterium]|nr:DEAD/DEAH box helicase [Deltaproteobacteria bacterium]